ncbi:DPP IV N-terminal domain-containing protein, partial [Porticoccaceae bacterium]|nr:DPP IV N-terminal domain-containing protein [Porticoccaceae bacterium]
MNPTLKTVTFTAFETHWVFDENNKSCQRLDAIPEGYVVSPNGKQAAFVRDYNLWVRDLTTGKEHALTQDGEEFYRYASVPTLGKGLPAITDFLWSPDSSRILTQVTDTRDVRIGMPLMQYVMPDGQGASILKAERRLSACGDEQVEAWQFLSLEVQSAKVQMFDCIPCPVRYPHYLGCFSAGRGWWDADSRHAYCIHQNVDETGTQVLKCDTHTGEVQVLFREMPETHATIVSAVHISIMAMPLPERDELIWYSERSGWPHLYLIDLKSGQLKRALTQGDWVVRKILFYDAPRQQLVIQTAGRHPGRNPYYQDICRIDLASGELTPLLASDHEYTVYDRCGLMDLTVVKSGSASKGASPTGNYLVATRSRVDEPPVSLLLDRDGKELMVVETADLSALPDNWQWPEPVMVKGADDSTDIYGVVFRPSGFSPDKNYPVLDLSFTYSEPVGAFSNNVQSNYHYLASVAYAELGFIVVRFNNRGDGLRGSAGLRDRAFNAYRDTRLPFHNKADCVAGIRQLVQRFPYMDEQRVGVADFITVPAAISGLFAHPDCYSVGVSFNAMVGDGRFWSRAIYKDEGFPSFADLAHQLKGKFLMIH